MVIPLLVKTRSLSFPRRTTAGTISFLSVEGCIVQYSLWRDRLSPPIQRRWPHLHWTRHQMVLKSLSPDQLACLLPSLTAQHWREIADSGEALAVFLACITSKNRAGRVCLLYLAVCKLRKTEIFIHTWQITVLHIISQVPVSSPNDPHFYRQNVQGTFKKFAAAWHS